MGQKVNPISYRLGLMRNWGVRWFANKNCGSEILEDYEIRRLIGGKKYNLFISDLRISKNDKNILIRVKISKPGLIIGKKGSELKHLKSQISRFTTKKVHVVIREHDKDILDSDLISKNISNQISNRIPYKKILKYFLNNVKNKKIGGVKIMMSGRLNGSDMSKSERLKIGNLPLSTVNKKIKYSLAVSRTLYGLIGVKVWVSPPDD